MQLKNNKVTLRPISLEDAPRFVRWINNPAVSKPLRGHHKRLTLKEEKEWIKGLSKKRKTEKQFSIDTAEGMHIGSTGLVIDSNGKVAAFGIEIGDIDYWGKGYGFAATSLLMEYAFTVLKLHKVELRDGQQRQLSERREKAQTGQARAATRRAGGPGSHFSLRGRQRWKATGLAR